jgi:hypothetical protein
MLLGQKQDKKIALIQSLARGLELLELVGEAGQPVSLPEMTRHLKIDRSSVFRLAVGCALLLGGVLVPAAGPNL